MWNLAAKAMVMVSENFANLHRIKFPLHVPNINADYVRLTCA